MNLIYIPTMITPELRAKAHEEETRVTKIICEFYGGRFAGTMTLEDAEKLTDERTTDLSARRARGELVRRPILDNKPCFGDYAGPMWNGIDKDGCAKLRYEASREIF